jgi:hypothetical protein
MDLCFAAGTAFAAADLLTIDARVTRSALLPRFAWLAALAYEAFRTRNATLAR